MPKMKCRWSPTLGKLEDTHQNVWGTEDWKEGDVEPTVFFGLYGLPDFYSMWRHKGDKYILWAGSDIIHFKNGYHLEDGGGIRLDPAPLAEWIQNHAQSWVENDVERKALEEYGIYSKVCPSFLGDVNNFQITEKKTDKKRYYTSVSGNNFKLYGWDKVIEIAKKNPDNEYHMYGNTEPFFRHSSNVIFHGRVPKEQMNEEIKSMTGCIRMVEFDGFSEIVAKAVLMGQEVISAIDYPFLKAENPREELLKIVNKYPWNEKN